jgi:hypothetical protein
LQSEGRPGSLLRWRRRERAASATPAHLPDNEDLERVRELGHGSFGKVGPLRPTSPRTHAIAHAIVALAPQVYEVVQRHSQLRFALKVLALGAMGEAELAHLDDELRIMVRPAVQLPYQP